MRPKRKAVRAPLPLTGLPLLPWHSDTTPQDLDRSFACHAWLCCCPCLSTISHIGVASTGLERSLLAKKMEMLRQRTLLKLLLVGEGFSVHDLSIPGNVLSALLWCCCCRPAGKIAGMRARSGCGSWVQPYLPPASNATE